MQRISRRRHATVAETERETIALGYGRVSTDEQEEEGVSLVAQAEVRRRYIAERSGLGWIVGTEYEDVLSGQKDDRPDYQATLAEARELAAAGKRVIVVVSMLDRLGRRARERIAAYEDLDRIGVQIHSVHEGGVVDELMYNMLAAIAQQESRNIRIRVRQSIRHFEQGGWHTPGSRAWGYTSRPRTPDEKANGAPRSILIPDPVEAPYVREAFRRYADGASIRAIARWAAGLPLAARGGRNLSYAVIRRVLRAPVYISRHGGAEVDTDVDLLAILDEPRGRWEPLIDDETWVRAAQQGVEARRLPHQASGAFALTGMLYCDRCGERMSGRTQKTYDCRRTPYRRQYVCNAKSMLGAATGGTVCSRVVSAEAIEQPVLRTVREMIDALDQPELRRRADAERARREQLKATDAQERMPRLAQLEQQRQRQTAARAALNVSLSLREFSKRDYDEAVEHVLHELARIDAELATLRGRARPADPIDAAWLVRHARSWGVAVASSDPATQRPLFATIFERVSPHPLARGRYEVDVALTPVGRRLLEYGLASREPSENLVAVGTSGLTKVSTGTTPRPLPTTRQPSAFSRQLSAVSR